MGSENYVVKHVQTDKTEGEQRGLENVSINCEVSDNKKSFESSVEESRNNSLEDKPKNSVGKRHKAKRRKRSSSLSMSEKSSESNSDSESSDDERRRRRKRKLKKKGRKERGIDSENLSQTIAKLVEG